MLFAHDLLAKHQAAISNGDTLENERQAFCGALRAARERAGVTLEALAASTKIRESYFEGLERNDLRTWPAGFFRRAMFRDYVRTIRLPIEPTLDEFLRLFPDDQPDVGARRAPAERPSMESEPAPRLMLAGRRRVLPAARWIQVVAAIVDVAGVMLAALVLTWWGAANLWTAVGFVSLCYYPITTMCFGRSFAAWWTHRHAGWPSRETSRPAWRGAIRPYALSGWRFLARRSAVVVAAAQAAQSRLRTHISRRWTPVVRSPNRRASAPAHDPVSQRDGGPGPQSVESGSGVHVPHDARGSQVMRRARLDGHTSGTEKSR